MLGFYPPSFHVDARVCVFARTRACERVLQGSGQSSYASPPCWRMSRSTHPPTHLVASSLRCQRRHFWSKRCGPFHLWGGSPSLTKISLEWRRMGGGPRFNLPAPNKQAAFCCLRWLESKTQPEIKISEAKGNVLCKLAHVAPLPKRSHETDEGGFQSVPSPHPLDLLLHLDSPSHQKPKF